MAVGAQCSLVRMSEAPPVLIDPGPAPGRRRARVGGGCRVQDQAAPGQGPDCHGHLRACRAGRLHHPAADDLFVVRIAGLRVGQLVEIDQFIQTNQQARETGQPHEARHKLELVIDLGIVDDASYAERLPRIGLGGELPPQPSDGIGLELLVALLMATTVSRNDVREVVAVHQLG